MSRSNTRVGESIENKAHPKQKSAINSVCKIMDNILTEKFKKVEDLAKGKFPEELLIETTDLRSLWTLMNGMCHKSTIAKRLEEIGVKK